MSAANPLLSVRSYVLRQGRMTKAQERAMRDHAEEYLIPANTPPPDGWAAVFGRQAPLVVEVGSGYGEATAALAVANPQRDYVAIEVHTPGIGALVKRLAEEQIANVRIVHGDAITAVATLFAPGSVAGFNLFFPDPWHKKRHHKRRIVRPSVVALLAQRLAPGGGVHFVTDWAPYAEQAAQVLADHPQLTPHAPPLRAPTGYERRAQAAAREVQELYFVKGESPKGFR